MPDLFLCGAGNPQGVRLALAINRKEQRWDRISILDDDEAKHGQSILGVEVTGSFAALGTVPSVSSEVSNMVARTTVGRWTAGRKIDAYGLRPATLIHPSVDPEGVEYADAVTAYDNAILCAEASIADGAVVFMGAVVGHECRVGRGCVVASNAVLNARVELADGVYVGTNAAILPEVKVGPWATIGAGSMVAQDVPAGATVLGVPGKTLMLRPSVPWPEEIERQVALWAQSVSSE